jgi:hypothetical protein
MCGTRNPSIWRRGGGSLDQGLTRVKWQLTVGLPTTRLELGLIFRIWFPFEKPDPEPYSWF